VTIVCPRLRLTRAGVFILLAVLVAFLGGVAKHSQFEGPPHSGYLSKAVKMAGARAESNLTFESGTCPSTGPTVPLPVQNQPPLSVLGFVDVKPVSFLSPPLRV
jgi:hypothetical protein